MLRYVVRRLLLLVPILLGVSILIFFWVHALPGNPASALLGERATPELVKQYKERYGLDRPLPLQYVDYLKVTVHGDLGTSITTRRTVASEIKRRFPATIELAIAAMIFAVGIGLPLGFFAAKHYGGVFDNLSLDRLADRHLDPDLLPGDHPQVLLRREVAAGCRASAGRTSC